jgi:hypothetical protein
MSMQAETSLFDYELLPTADASVLAIDGLISQL